MINQVFYIVLSLFWFYIYLTMQQTWDRSHMLKKDYKSIISFFSNKA